MSISLEQSDWLRQFIDLVFERYPAEEAKNRAAQIAVPQRGYAALIASLDSRGASFGFPTLDPTVSESQEFAYIKFLSTLKHQVEVVFDVAVALERPFQGLYGQLALSLFWWTSLQEPERAKPLAEAWAQIVAQQKDIQEFSDLLEEQLEALGEALKDRAILKADPLLALPVNQGISYFDIRLMGLLAVSLYETLVWEPHRAEHILHETHNDRIRCVEATIALVWSNGILEAEERNLVKKQIEMLRLDKKDKRKLMNLMITPSSPKEFAQGFSSEDTAMFVLRQLVIASFIDGTQDAKEKKFLFQSSKAFGLDEEQFNGVQDEIRAFIDANRDSIEQMKKYRRARPSMV